MKVVELCISSYRSCKGFVFGASDSAAGFKDLVF